MNIMVTGAAGFIGSHLIDRLLLAGHSVVGLDNLKLGRRMNLSAALRTPACRLHVCDMADATTLEHLVAEECGRQPIDAVWHLAANSDIQAGGADFDVDMRDTFLTTHNLLKAMRRFGLRRLAFASSSAIYGAQPDVLVEDMGPLFPISNYGAMKLASEAAISAALESYLEKVWIFRFPNVVGGRATHGVIHDFVKRLLANGAVLQVLGDGTQQKPYFHVSDLVDAMLFIAGHASERLNFYNIGTTSTATTVKYIAEAVVRAMGGTAAIHYGKDGRGWVGDVPRFSYSVEKLAGLGWRPRRSSDEAVDLAVREIVDELTR